MLIMAIFKAPSNPGIMFENRSFKKFIIFKYEFTKRKITIILPAIFMVFKNDLLNFKIISFFITYPCFLLAVK